MRTTIPLLIILYSVLSYCSNIEAFRLSNHQRFGKRPFNLVFMSSTSVDVSGSPYVPSGTTILRSLGLSKAYTSIPQFNDISVTLGRGQRVGLIGVNGAGKSTLLRCLAGIDKADSGSVEVASNANVIYVDQEPDWGDITVYTALFAGDDPKARATRQYFEVLAMDADMDADAFSRATDAMEEASAWDYQTNGLNIAEKLKIDSTFMNRKVSTLSGGERKRVGLSAALLRQPDVLLLDEPTNHLDIEALDWLSDYLKPGKDKDLTMLLVTHDRYFLEKVCSEILELDRAAIYRYPGNYQRYLELKEARLQAADADTERAKIKLRRESEWMAKQPRARQAKSKVRQEQFYTLVDKVKAGSVGKQDKALELVTQEEKDKQTRLGKTVIEFNKACYESGPRVLLDGFSYSFRQRDRIGVVGSNGVGKSTFLKVLVGMLPLTGGAVKVGDTVKIGYYEQTGLNLTAEQQKTPVLKFVQEEVEKGGGGQEKTKGSSLGLKVEVDNEMGRRKRLAGKEGSINVQFEETLSASTSVSERDAMSLLTRFQFPSKRWYDRVGQLSGGERRRLQLLQILARQPNVLVLDEPSNDLDLMTLSTLEEYLTEVFEGCLVVVSHDRFFMDRVAEHIFVFEGEGVVRDFQGSYSEYLDYRKDEKDLEKSEKSQKSTPVAAAVVDKKKSAVTAEAKAAADGSKNSVPTSKSVSTGASSGSGSPNASSLSYADRKEMQKLEKEIGRLEAELAAVRLKLANSDGSEGYSTLAEWSAEEVKIMGMMQAKEARWLALVELD